MKKNACKMRLNSASDFSTLEKNTSLVTIPEIRIKKR
jgi:hypothetical protein